MESLPTSPVRRIAERLLGRIVVRRRLPVPADDVAVYASARVAGLRYLFRSSDRIDPDLIAVARFLVQVNSIVWDVGANVGLFSAAAAHYAGPSGGVWALEPDLEAFTLLSHSASRMSKACAPISVVPIAVSDATSIAWFCIAKRARSTNYLHGFGTTQAGGVAESRLVPCFSLDELLKHLPPPDVVKVDVEGAEAKVLRGGTGMLRSVRPSIACEVSSASRHEVTMLLRQCGYAVWSGTAFDPASLSEDVSSCDNIVAIPAERAQVRFQSQ